MQRKWENAKKIRRVSYQRCSPFFIIIFFTRLSISSMSCGKNSWSQTFGTSWLFLDWPWIVSAGRVLVYIQVMHHLWHYRHGIWLTSDLMFFPFGSPDRSTGDRLRQCRQRKNGKQKNWMVKESSVFVPGFFVLPAWRTNARIYCIE